MKVPFEYTEAQAGISKSSYPQDLLCFQAVKDSEELGSEESMPPMLRDDDITITWCKLRNNLEPRSALDAGGWRNAVIESRFVQGDIRAITAMAVLELHDRDAGLITGFANTHDICGNLACVVNGEESLDRVDDHVDDYQRTLTISCEGHLSSVLRQSDDLRSGLWTQHIRVIDRVPPDQRGTSPS